MCPQHLWCPGPNGTSKKYVSKPAPWALVAKYVSKPAIAKHVSNPAYRSIQAVLIMIYFLQARKRAKGAKSNDWRHGGRITVSTIPCCAHCHTLLCTLRYLAVHTTIPCVAHMPLTAGVTTAAFRVVRCGHGHGPGTGRRYGGRGRGRGSGGRASDRSANQRIINQNGATSGCRI